MNTRVTVGLFAALALAALAFAGCGETAGSSDGANEIKPANNNPLGGGGSSIDGASGFQVIFDPQGGEWTVGDDDPYWEKAVNADGTVNLPDETLIRRNGMILLGWYDSPQPEELTPVKNRQSSEGDEETLDEAGGEPPAAEAVSAGVEPPYLAADAEVPDGGIFTEGVILEKNTTLYAYWQELSPNAAIITFIPYWTSGAKGFKRQALAEKEYMLAEPLPLVTGGPKHYHPVDSYGSERERIWFKEMSGAEVFDGYSTEDITVYGRWAGNEYTVKFDFNGGVLGSAESAEEKYTYSKEKKNTVTLNKSGPIVAPDGYDGFLGWFTEQKTNIKVDIDTYAALPDENDSTRFEEGVTPLDGDLTVYALWQDRPNGAYKITFEQYEGSGTITSTMYALVEGEKHKPERGLPNTGDKTMDHYTLAGEGAWYYKDEVGTEHKLTESTDVTKDITAYLKWEGKTYTVTFDKKDGSVPAVLSITYPVNKLETLAALDAAGTGTREHYHCDTKWYLSGGAEFVAGPEGEGGAKIAEITGNITVTPNWEGNVYEMKYYANDGTGTLLDSITRTYPAAIAAFPAAPSRTYWGFDGWYDTQEASGGTKITTDYVLTGNMKVYARWDAGTVEITGITAKYGSVKAKINETISGSTINYTSSIPAFVVNESVVVSITAKATYGTPTISPEKTISYSSYKASGGSTESFTVTAPNGVAKTYNIKFTKDTTNKQMASGGTITYVKIGSGTSATWDEVHIFTSTGKQTLAFTAGRRPSGLKGRVLIVGGGGGGGGSSSIINYHGGGGGSGGVAYGASIELGDSTDVDVGKGGGGGDGSDKTLINSYGKNGDNGYQSSFGSAIAHGGGGGGGGSGLIFIPGGAGNSGGSGGGGGGGGSSSGNASGGDATQGSVSARYDLKGSPGGSGSSSGDGGTGGSASFTNDITGSNVIYGVGGLNGNSNTGNGGGGGATANEMGRDGGSGIVVVRFPFSDQ